MGRRRTSKIGEKFNRCVKSVRTTVRARPKSSKESAAIAICTKSVLQTRGRTLKRYRKGRLVTQTKLRGRRGMKKVGGTSDEDITDAVTKFVSAISQPILPEGGGVMATYTKDIRTDCYTIKILDHGEKSTITSCPYNHDRDVFEVQDRIRNYKQRIPVFEDGVWHGQLFLYPTSMSPEEQYLTQVAINDVLGFHSRNKEEKKFFGKLGSDSMPAKRVELIATSIIQRGYYYETGGELRSVAKKLNEALETKRNFRAKRETA